MDITWIVWFLEGFTVGTIVSLIVGRYFWRYIDSKERIDEWKR